MAEITGKSGTKKNFFLAPVSETLSDKDRQKLKNLNLKLPKGSLIHFVNILNMWRHSPDRYVACAAYAEFWGVGNKTIAAVVKAVAEFEGRTTEVAYHQGQKAGVRIVKLNGSPTVEPVTAERSSAPAEHPESDIWGTSDADRKQIASNLNGSDDLLNGPQESSTVQRPLTQRSRNPSIDEGINDLVDELVDEKDLRRNGVSPACVDRKDSFKAIDRAVELFDQVQMHLGGRRSDDATISTLRQAVQGLDEDTAVARLAVGLQAAHGWYWVKAQPSRVNAGRCLHAALQGKIYELEPQINCDVMTDQPPWWDGSVWRENISDDTFSSLVAENIREARRPADQSAEVESEFAAVKAAAPLDKEMHLGGDECPLEAVTEPAESVSASEVNPAVLVNAVSGCRAAVPETNLPERVHPFKDGLDGLELSKRKQQAIAKLTAAAIHIPSQPPITTTPSTNTPPDCGEDWFTQNFGARSSTATAPQSQAINAPF